MSPIAIAVGPPRFGIARRRPGIACTGTEEVTKTFRFVASCFADVPSYERDLLVSEVSEDVATPSPYESRLDRDYTNNRAKRLMTKTKHR